MVVPIGGSRTIPGLIYSYGEHEHIVLDLRAKMLESNEIKTRSAYRTIPRNYGDLSMEMSAETTSNVTTPFSAVTYSMDASTPIFVETMRADSVAYAGMAQGGSTTTVINLPMAPNNLGLYVGAEIEINGQTRIVQATGATSITLTAALPAAPSIGSLVLLHNRRDIPNPHPNQVYRFTDKYGSAIVEGNRFQVDRETGLIRYRPLGNNTGLNNLATAGFTYTAQNDSVPAGHIWHPEALLNKNYYFGRAIEISQLPPVASAAASAVVEQWGETTDPVASNAAPTTLTNFTLTGNNGQYSNIRVTIPPGVGVDIELNGGKLLTTINTTGAAVQATIPFFDPVYDNDHLKATENIDPDTYIQKYLKMGFNQFGIKAFATVAGNANRGVRLEGQFNGITLDTANAHVSAPETGFDPRQSQLAGVAYNTTTPLSYARNSDWSTSQWSVLGTAGRIEFELADRVALEDVTDQFARQTAVLESLTTIIAGTDINQVNSMFSVIR